MKINLYAFLAAAPWIFGTRALFELAGRDTSSLAWGLSFAFAGITSAIGLLGLLMRFRADQRLALYLVAVLGAFIGHYVLPESWSGYGSALVYLGTGIFLMRYVPLAIWFAGIAAVGSVLREQTMEETLGWGFVLIGALAMGVAAVSATRLHQTASAPAQSTAAA